MADDESVSYEHWLSVALAGANFAIVLGLLQLQPMSDWPITIASYAVAVAIPPTLVASIYTRQPTQPEETFAWAPAFYVGLCATGVALAALLSHLHIAVGLAFIAATIVSAYVALHVERNRPPGC